MSVDSDLNRVQISGSGTITPIAFNRKVFAATDIVGSKEVTATGVVTSLVQGTDYTVTGAGNTSTGVTITPLVAPAVGERWVFWSDQANTQASVYTENDRFAAKTTEYALDKQSIGIQDQSRYNDLALRYPDTEDSGTSGALPVVNDRKSKALGFDASGDISMITVNNVSASNASGITYDPAGAGAVATTVQAKLRESVSVKDFGAVGDGSTDDTAAIQAALDAAKGADTNAVGRRPGAIYFPSPVGGFYKITDTLVVDGTYGLIIDGDGALNQRTGNPNNSDEATIRWYGSSSKPIFQLKGQTVTISNPNFGITIRDLTLSGYATMLDETATPPSDIALAGIYIGALDGDNQATLNRNINITNVEITDCRFGIYSDSPDGNNTDHAQVCMRDVYCVRNAEQALHWGAGNAIASLSDSTFFNNGWGADHYPADNYSAEIGANIYVVSGYLDIYSYTSAGKGDKKPIDADIYQTNGRVDIKNAWSDVHGYFFYQATASISDGAYHCSQISGVRHFEGAMDDTNTPNSIRIRVPGTTLESCMLHGDVVIDSGLGGRPICSGINFSTGHGFSGSGIDTQRSLINLGNLGNNAQILTGGADSGVDMDHEGVLAPQYLQMGTHSSGDTQSMATRQVLGAAATDSGYTEFFDAATGSKIVVINGYVSTASPLTITPHTIGLVYYITMGGTHGFEVLQKYSSDGTTPILVSAFNTAFEVRGVAATNDICLAFPHLASDPSTPSGDFWEGCVYYNTGTNKLRVNTGASTWADLH